MKQFFLGDLVKINQNLVKRSISIYSYNEKENYYYNIDSFELTNVGTILEFKIEEKMSYTKIITNDLKIGWVRNVYLEIA